MAAETNKVKTEVNNVKNTTKATVNRVKIAAPYAYVEVMYFFKYKIPFYTRYLNANAIGGVSIKRYPKQQFWS